MTAFKSASGVANLCWLSSRCTSPRPHPEAQPECRRALDPPPTGVGNPAGIGRRDTVPWPLLVFRPYYWPRTFAAKAQCP